MHHAASVSLAEVPTRSLWLVGLLILLFSCSTTPPADPTFEHTLVGRAPTSVAPADPADVRRGVLWYQLETRPDEIEVRLRLVGPPGRTSFFLPGAWAGRRDFATDISIRGAQGPEGPLTYTISRSDGRIDVDTSGEDWVELHYGVTVHGRQSSATRFRPQWTHQALLAYAPAFLVLPSEQIIRGVRDIPIEVRAPAEWRIASTWRHVVSKPSRLGPERRIHGFVAADPAELRDAFVSAGPELEIMSGGPGSRLSVAFAGPLRLPKTAFVEMLRHVLTVYRAEFGDTGPVTVLVRPLRDARNGQRQGGETRGIGRRGGFVLEVPARRQLDAEITLVTAHEAFHLWNGHGLTPQAGSERQTRWFKEGVTHYVALRTLSRLGLLDQEVVLAEIGRAASYYMRNPAARGRAANQVDRARLPYDRGMLLALAIDAALRHDTNGRLDIDAWLRHLFEGWAQRGRRYSTDDLRAALAAVAPSTDSTALALWRSHVIQGEPLDAPGVLERAGLHLLERPSGQVRVLPIRREDAPYRAIFGATGSR